MIPQVSTRSASGHAIGPAAETGGRPTPVMKMRKRKKTPSPKLERKRSVLEAEAAEKGIQIHYDLLEAAGLKLKGGLCWVNGEYHIFVDRRKPLTEQIDFIEDHLNRPLPEAPADTAGEGFNPDDPT